MQSREPIYLVRGHSVATRDPQGRRDGFTTGTSAAAATKAACLVLARGETPEQVSVTLPTGRALTIQINRIEYDGGRATCGVIKDAGDDPDVTHGAEILATVRIGGAAGIRIQGGAGVGTVTKPGVGLPVGSPAITLVPQRMIRLAVAEVLLCEQPDPGVEVTISVPDGERLAAKTSNARLGIVGGISILGTTGIVQAMSTAAWRASILQAIDVAAANGLDHLVFSTGERTEQFAMSRFKLPEMAFIEMGIFTGDCMRRSARKKIPRVTICGMIGKLTKLAQGQLQTHVAGGVVDGKFLTELARKAGLPEEVVGEVARGNSARHVQELVAGSAGTPAEQFFGEICRRAAAVCSGHVQGVVEVGVLLFDADGLLLGDWC